MVQAFGGKREFTSLMNVGLLIAGVAGLILAAPWGLADGAEPNYAKIGVKLVILLIIGALIGIGLSKQRKSGSVAPALFWLVGILTVVNAGIALLW
ncbi:Fe-S protein [Microbacterium sp. CH12i]|uniref:Fe-S protein n=1 Tax=Microbacterium sp. CH12i TaxID=1479651 RepID=UPI000A6705A2